jgi:hypothetical protein
VSVARRYCAWAETSANNPQQEMRQARELLAELHLAVMRLPETDFDESERTDSLTYSCHFPKIEMSKAEFFCKSE